MDFIHWDLDRKEFPVNVSQFDQILMLDIIEHLKGPEDSWTSCASPPVASAGDHHHDREHRFFVTRLMLLFGPIQLREERHPGRDPYPAFYLSFARELLEQSGYKMLEVRGIPAPFPKALGANFIVGSLVWANEKLISLSRAFFSYQIFVRAQAQPTVNNLLRETINTSQRIAAERAAQCYFKIWSARSKPRAQARIDPNLTKRIWYCRRSNAHSAMMERASQRSARRKRANRATK